MILYYVLSDEIHCVGHDVIQAVRKDALAHNPNSKGDFYALHIRRGDFQFKVRYYTIKTHTIYTYRYIDK